LPIVEEIHKLPPEVAKTLRTTTLKTIMNPEWMRSAKCPVCLCVDLDGQVGWTADGIEKLVPVTEGEYGPRVAIWRILNLLDKHEIKATFFATGWWAENYPETIKEMHKRGHELANHSYGHIDPGLQKREEEEQSLRRTNKIIQELTGQVPLGFRAPSGEYSSSTIRLLQEVGIVYDSTCSADDIPYWWVIDGKAINLLEIPFTWILDDAPHSMFSFYPLYPLMKSPTDLYDLWTSEFDGLYNYGRCCVLTVHPEFVGRPNRIMMLERFIQHVKSFKDAPFVKMIDLFRHWQQRYPPGKE